MWHRKSGFLIGRRYRIRHWGQLPIESLALIQKIQDRLLNQWVRFVGVMYSEQVWFQQVH